LLNETDDKFVIMHHGDEISLEFPYNAASAGMERDFIIYSWDYYKQPPYIYGDSVDPLPFAAMSNYPYPPDENYPSDAEHLDYLSTWNTREYAFDPSKFGGMSLPFSTNNTVFENTIIGNMFSTGLHLLQESDTKIINNRIYNTETAIFIIDSDLMLISENNITNSSVEGIYLEDTTNSNLTGNKIFNSGQTGLYLSYTDNTLILNDHYYNNSPDFYTEGSGDYISLVNVIFDSDGTFSNYTNISLNDTVASSYEIDWANQPAPLPILYRSFEGKFLNITPTSGTVSIDSIVWHWLESELAGNNTYIESSFVLMKYNASSWSLVSTSPDTTANTLSLSNMNPSSTYAILEYVPDGGGDGGADGAGKNMVVEFEASCENNTVTVTSGGPLEGAEVLVDDKTTLSSVANGTTNSSGEFSFTGCGKTVKITVKKTDYTTAVTEELLNDCSLCTLLECTIDTDCALEEECVSNACLPVECDCGEIKSHQCFEYACCSDEDCETGEECVDKMCKEKPKVGCTSDDDCSSTESCEAGKCEEVTGACGKAVDHEWEQYECGEGCPSCSSGYVCTNNKCVEEEVTEPEEDEEATPTTEIEEEEPEDDGLGLLLLWGLGLIIIIAIILFFVRQKGSKSKA
jgi:parallel beta-helix repeat protein